MVEIGTVLKVREAMVGPKVLAGFSEAPEIGPNIQMMAERIRPIARPAKDWFAFLSVAPNIVKTRIAVAMISATRAATWPKSAPGRVSPRYVGLKPLQQTLNVVVLEDHSTSNANPAIVAPKN